MIKWRLSIYSIMLKKQSILFKEVGMRTKNQLEND